MMNKTTILLCCLIYVWGCSAPQTTSMENVEDQTRLNHIQIIGSHNSYKRKITSEMMELLLQEDSSAIGLDYHHIPLGDQLDLGLRSLELDILYDPNGGRYQSPVGLKTIDSLGLTTTSFDTIQELSKPGIKTFHIPDIDFRSHCLAFKDCLSDVKFWSKNNPDHLPIIITINPKNDGIDKVGFTKVLPFDQAALDSLDLEILSVFDESDLILPTHVLGNAENLRQAVTNHGWPLLTEVKGKIMFVLDAGIALTEQYLVNYEAGKPMFVTVSSDHPQAAFFVINDPLKSEKEIKNLVAQGFMVRTRSDANTAEARHADFSRFEAAIRSGVHVITTDYYLNSLSPNEDFEIIFEDSTYQNCNPIVASKTCTL